MKILVVDDHALVREGLRQILKGLTQDVEVLDAATCKQAFALSDDHPDLDLVLLDYHLPDMNGIDALDTFSQQHPELPIIVLSGSASPPIVAQAMNKGAAAFVTKSGRSDELLSVTRQVLAGETVTPYATAHAVHATPQPDDVASPPPPKFTPRQQEVLHLLLDGMSNKEIGRIMRLSDETVKNHVSAILRGFGVQTRTQAVLAAKGFDRYGKPSPFN